VQHDALPWLLHLKGWGQQDCKKKMQRYTPIYSNQQGQKKPPERFMCTHSTLQTIKLTCRQQLQQTLLLSRASGPWLSGQVAEVYRVGEAPMSSWSQQEGAV